jgi:glycerol kinase
MKYVMALDQGTTSTRCILFNHSGEVCSIDQMEHQQYFAKPGWVEHDPKEIWKNTQTVISRSMAKLGVDASNIAAIGITNQRETIIAFEPETGKIRHNAIVWQDLRGSEIINRLKETIDPKEFQEHSGLLLSPYFSASKIAWMLEQDHSLRRDAEKGKVVFGTIDTYLVYSLLGNRSDTVITDATNASRYALMNIHTCQWDPWLLDIFNIPEASLPRIVNSFNEVYGMSDPNGPLQAEVPVCGILGDQQAALFGQACFDSGEGKNTYGTGCFLLVNTGDKVSVSPSGLLTTVAYKEKGGRVCYALEGSIAVAGSLIQWLRDSLHLIKSAPEVDALAESVPNSGGVYIVPAFSGLFAPYWRSDARGVIAGLTGFATKAHIARAALEATAFQAKDIFDAIERDSEVSLKQLKVDGGLTNSRPLMEFQADLLQVPVVRPQVIETTALGAAYAA